MKHPDINISDTLRLVILPNTKYLHNSSLTIK